MTKNPLTVVFFFFFIFIPFHTGYAENNHPAASSLRLKKALELSLKNNSRSLGSREKIEEKRSLQLESRSPLLPHLSLDLLERNATTNLKAQGVSFPGAPDKVGPFSTFDARLKFDETILNLSQLNLYRAAQEETKGAELELGQTEEDIIYQTGLLYFNVLGAEASVETNKANVDLSEELMKFTQHQKETGVSTILDVTRAKVKLAQDRQKWISAIAQRDNALLALQKQIGISQAEAVILPDKNIQINLLPEMQESLKIALLRRKDLMAQAQKEKIKELQFKAAASEKYPSVHLFADYGESGNGITDAFPTDTVGISFNLPLYDGENRKGKELKIMSQFNQEKIITKDLSYQIELEVRQIYNDLNSVKRQQEAAEERLFLAEKELKLAEDRFGTGVGNHIELFTTQTSLTEARQGVVEAQYQSQITLLRYFYVTGQMNEFMNQISSTE